LPDLLLYVILIGLLMVERYMKKSTDKDIARNKKAFFEYALFEKLEAGIKLSGPEIKSIRQGKIALADSFVRIDGGEPYIYGLHISPYKQSGPFAPDPARPRKLLLHRSEIESLCSKVLQKGYTLIPTRLYIKRGFAKVEIAIARGKKLFDKRQALRQKTIDKEIRRSLR
jgi:SsrA-binding protein